MVRYFSYIDEYTIDSFYNQLDYAYDLERKSISKDKSLTGEIKISFKNIILGFLDGEGRVISERRRGSSEEIERSIKIENKIMELIKIADGDEKSKVIIDNSKRDKQLICGTIQVIECNAFLEFASKIYNKQMHSYEEFLENLENYDYNDNNDYVLWKNIISDLSYDSVLGNGVDPLKIITNWHQGEELFSFVVIDNIYPIIMDMSYKKITMPHSFMRSSGLFTHLTKFSVLGVLNKMNNRFFLKPLSLWNIIDTEVAQHYIPYGFKL